jgi:hypothetical protein
LVFYREFSSEIFKILMFKGTKATIQLHEYQFSQKLVEKWRQNRGLQNYVFHKNQCCRYHTEVTLLRTWEF